MMDEMERHETIHEYHARLSGPFLPRSKTSIKQGWQVLVKVSGEMPVHHYPAFGTHRPDGLFHLMTQHSYSLCHNYPV
jgi:hypothetical protein